MSLCAFCRAPAQGNYSVHISPSMTGPEVPLCDMCGGHETPLLSHIWHAIEHGYGVTCLGDVVIGCMGCGGFCQLVNPTTSILWNCSRCHRDYLIPHFDQLARHVRELREFTTLLAETNGMRRPDAKWNF